MIKLDTVYFSGLWKRVCACYVIFFFALLFLTCNRPVSRIISQAGSALITATATLGGWWYNKRKGRLLYYLLFFSIHLQLMHRCVWKLTTVTLTTEMLSLSITWSLEVDRELSSICKLPKNHLEINHLILFLFIKYLKLFAQISWNNPKTSA